MNIIAPASPSSGAANGPSAPVSATNPSAETLAKKLVKSGGSADQTDVDAVVGELQKMPISALQMLDTSNVKVVAARGSVTDYATKLRGVHPRGWPPGKTWDAVPGAYMPGENAVVVATVGSGSNTHIPLTGHGHGSLNLVVHEATHAIDAKTMPSRNSSSAAFLAARMKDLGALSAYERQTGIAGPSETYAGSAARFYGGSNIKSTTPSLDAYWRTDPLGGK